MSSCDKTENSSSAPVAPSPTPATEASAPAPPSPEASPTPPSTAQQKLEAQSYYTKANLAVANPLIEGLSPAIRQSILEHVGNGKKIEAVKLIRNVQKTSLAVSKLAVEMIAISEGVDPGIH